MAFSDNPIVDKSSAISEDSVTAVKGILSVRCGFIVRIENPDYGVDFDVELIAEGVATSQKFAVQIKSAENINLIEKDGHQFISLNFKTSRIGYLCRRPPAYGIITIYDSKSKLTYFDYVDDIVKRLDETGRDWRKNESVNIHIPLNELNPDAAKILHNRMLLRHRNNELLLISRGSEYDIPHYSRKEGIDLNNHGEIVKFLKEFGSYLFNEQKFNFLAGIISKVPNQDILKSDDLIFLAAIVFGNTGNVIEAEYYIERYYRRKKPPIESETEVVEYSRFKIEFLKGNLNYQKYHEKLVGLKSRSKSENNILNLEINILYLEILKAIGNRQLDIATEENISLLFQKIESSSLDMKLKNQLKLFHSQNLNIYATSQLLNEVNKIRTRKKIGISTDFFESNKRIDAISSFINKAKNYAAEVYNYSIEANDSSLKARALNSLARFFLNHQFTLLMLRADQNLELNEITEILFNSHISSAVEAYNLSIADNLLDEAHRALNCIYDLEMVFQVQFKKETSLIVIPEIERLLKDIERQTGILPFESNVKKAYNNIRGEALKQKSMKDYSDEELEQLAPEFLKAYELPIDRLGNILHSLKTLKIFEENCSNQNIEILEDLRHRRTKETLYKDEVKFILRSKISGIETKPSSNIYSLLDQFKTILK